MKKPLKFKSGFYTWRIIWSEEKADECFGKTDVGSKTIIIYKHDNSEVERETLLHEILHAVMDDKCEAVFGYEGVKMDDKEENLIRLISPVLMGILFENRTLQNYLFRR